MRIKIGNINLLSLQDWSDYNLFYILVGALLILYCVYYFTVESISDSKNRKVRYSLPVTFSFDQKNITQTSIEAVRDFFSQIHSLSNDRYNNEVIGLNIVNNNGTIESNITLTSESSLNTIKEALLKNRSSQIEVGDISIWNGNYILTNDQKLLVSQLKIQKNNYPIKCESLTFGADLINSIYETNNSILSLTLLPYNYQSKFEYRARGLLQPKQNDKGAMYVSENNKVIAKQLEEKSRYPLFLTKIEIIAFNNQSIRQITSKFNILSSNHNRFYPTNIKNLKKNKIENKINIRYWFSGLMPKYHFYLNSQELACIWQPLKKENDKNLPYKNALSTLILP
jgi:hypothetical protein